VSTKTIPVNQICTDPLKIDLLIVDSRPEFDFYVLEEEGYTLFNYAKEPFSRSKYDTLTQGGHEHFFIRFEDNSTLARYMESHLDSLITSSLPNDEKSKILYQTARSVLDDLFNHIDRPENITRVKSVAKTTLEALNASSTLFDSFLNIDTGGVDHVTHSVDVMLLSIRLATRLGLSKQDLSALAIGALLHDIGKCKLRAESANDAARLRHHPVYGERLLRKMGESDPRILACVRQHHEMRDGSGYPDGIKADKIHPFAQIIAIPNTFSSLIEGEVDHAFKALQQMKKAYTTKLDQRIVDHFVKMLAE